MVPVSLLLLALAASPPPQDLPGVKLVGSGWTSELVHELGEGLDALPPEVRAFPGGPLELELHEEPSPHGLGSALRPEWTSGMRRFHLYRYQEGADARASARLGGLDPRQRERLWRRRAIVHAVIARWDAERRWSQSRDWRKVTGWLAAFDRPTVLGDLALNRYAWAFSRQRGMDSPALDFATFAEEALITPEAVGGGPGPADESVRCQEFSKLRVLSAALAEVSGADPDALLGSAPCPAFERAMRPCELSHAEVLYAAPSATRPESLFGHVLLRFVYRDSREGAALAPSFDPVFQIGAISGELSGADFAVQGLTGGLATVFTRTRLATVLAENVERDQRTIRRYRLELTALERRRLLERAWELERRGFPAYYFTSENCASWLLFMINGALEGPREVARPGLGLFVLPTAVLDALTSAPGTRAGRLATPLPGAFRAHRERAEEALALMLGAVKDPVARRQLRRAVRSTRPQVRAAAYASFAQAADAGSRVALAAILYEQYGANQATVALEQVQANREVASLARPPRTTEELLAKRQALFRVEDERAHAAATARAAVEHLDSRTAARLRAPTWSERVAQHRAQDLLQTFAATAGWVGNRVSPEEAAAWDREVAARELEEEAAFLRRARPSSGLGVAELRAQLSAQGRPSLGVGFAVARERLGDQRASGFSPSTEVRFLDGGAELSAGPEGVALDALGLELIRFASARTELEAFRSRPTELFGFGGGLRGEWRRTDGLRITAHGAANLATATSARFATLAFASAGVAVSAGGHRSGAFLAVGPRLEAVARVQLGELTALRGEVVYEPQYDLQLGRLSHSVDAELALEINGRKMALRPLLTVSRREASGLRLAAGLAIEID